MSIKFLFLGILICNFKDDLWYVAQYNWVIPVVGGLLNLIAKLYRKLWKILI